MTDRVRYQTIAEELAKGLGDNDGWPAIVAALEDARDDGHGEGCDDTWEEAEAHYNAVSLQDEADAYWLEFDRERGAVA